MEGLVTTSADPAPMKITDAHHPTSLTFPRRNTSMPTWSTGSWKLPQDSMVSCRIGNEHGYRLDVSEPSWGRNPTPPGAVETKTGARDAIKGGFHDPALSWLSLGAAPRAPATQEGLGAGISAWNSLKTLVVPCLCYPCAHPRIPASTWSSESSESGESL